MSVYIHVGYPKNASTWFQSKLFPFINNYKYITREETNKLFFFSDTFLFNPFEIKNHIDYTDNKSFLFSSEALTTTIHYTWHMGALSKSCADKIKATFPNAKIIIFIRNQQSLITSAYQQYLKGGGSYRKRRYLYSKDVFKIEHLYYDKLIEYYDKLFGKENISVYPFEDFRNDPKKFVKQFCETHNFEVDIDRVDFNVVNQGLRKGMVILLRFLNLFHKWPLGLKKHIIHIPRLAIILKKIILPLNKHLLFGPYLTPSAFLNDNDMVFLFKSYYESNRRLANRIGVEVLKKHNYLL